MIWRRVTRGQKGFRCGSGTWLLALVLATAFPHAHGELMPQRPPSQLALSDLAGKTYSLQQSAGKVVVVNFWTTWCPPCREEMPSLGRMAGQLRQQGIVVVAVNVAEPASRVKRFRRLPKGGVKVLLDTSGEQAGVWGVDRYPTAFIIDREGRVRQRFAGVIDWDASAERDALLKLAH